MNRKQLVLMLAPTLVAVVVAGACGEKGDDTGEGTDTTSSTTGTPTGPVTPGVTTPGAPTPGGATTPGAVTPGGTPAAPPTGVTPSTSGTATGPVSSCSNTDNDGVDPTTIGISGANWVYTYSDGTEAACMIKTTSCLESTQGQLCLGGTAAESQSDYKCYGAGIGIQMAVVTDNMVQVAWDASMAGVAGVKATLSGVAGGPGIRAQISQSDLPDDASFVYGAGTKDIKADGEVTMMFTDFEFPSWVLSAHTDYSADTRIDPTKVKGLQFQVVTSGKAKDYHFCISDLQWLDASMMPVTVAPLTSASGSPSGEAGGPSTMPSGSGSSEAGGAGGGGPVGPGPAEADAGTDTSTDTATDTETDMGMGGAGGAGP